MEYNVFRDYCKAENSEDEEVNRDLQSRLYAEIYYASNDTVKEDTKTNIKVETLADDQKLCKNEGINRLSGSNASIISNSADASCKQAGSLNDSVNNASIVQKDDKADIKSICVTNEIDSLGQDINNKGSSPVSCAKALKHTEDNLDVLKNNKQLSTCHSLESIKSISDHHNACNIENDVKAEIEIETKETLKSTQCLNCETASQPSLLNNTKHISENNNDMNENVPSSETNVDNEHNNILQKYEFSKLFINKLYLEKYEMLEKKLQELEEERQRNVVYEEHVRANIEEIEENHRQHKTNNSLNPTNRAETNTKYKVLSKTEKVQTPAECLEEITVLSSETESDSEESILEVPIPPKPQPPVINLQDSDESSDILSSDNDTDQDDLFITEENNDSPATVEKKSCTIDNDIDSSTSMINAANKSTITEDIVLNCTEVQKAASSIKEIMEMSKTVQSAQCSGDKGSHCDNEVYKRSSNDSNIPLSFTGDKNNTSEAHLPPKTININNVVYERDKDETINFAEDVIVSNFVYSNERTPSRKRHRENEDKAGTSMIQEEDIGNENKRYKISLGQHSKNKSKKESLEECSLRPMSENVKSISNESQRPDDFDLQQIQSKMSKDPRLWAILDEDLMPELLKRQRYWNLRCNNCQQQGHQRHNCPKQYEPIRCHMCGTAGHTESRCPQKMCLTCGRKQGTFRKTCESCRTLYCNMCKAIGHKSGECPDLWRRFHQTTRTSEINIPENISEVMKPADLLYCCNCTKRGHDSSMCHEYRWSPHFPTPAYVSNYTDGPEYEGATHGNTNEDVIPLVKIKKSRNLVFTPGTDDLDNCYVIYSYGTFHTKRANGEEIKRKLIAEQVQMSHLTNLLKGRVVPSFLDQLSKILKFKIDIYYNANKELMIRVRSIVDTCKRVLEIFVFWLKLEDGDKQLNIDVGLPRKADKLLKLLAGKLEDLDKHLEHPNYLCSQIEQLKLSIPNIRDSTELRATSQKILDLRSKLMKVFHTKPKSGELVKRLKQAMKSIKQRSPSDVNLVYYLNIIVIYNKMFVPRALTEVELQRFRDKYKKAKVKEKKKKGEENNEVKKQKKNATPYETFVQNLRKFNITSTSETANTNIKANKMGVNKNARKNVEIQQDKQVSTTTSTVVESVSTSTNVQSNTQIATHTTKNVSNETSNVEPNAAKATVVYPTECIDLPRNQDISGSIEAASTTNKANVIVSSDSISVLAEKSTHTNVSSKQSKNEHLPSTANVQTKSLEAIEIDLTTANEVVVTTVKTSNLHESGNVDSESNVHKRKKSKKAKKAKLDHEYISEVTESQTKNIDTSMQAKANEIINKALAFSVPYMNKAAEEVRNRINDKNLKQEHIDTLQRLINLENDHRKYVSSFCNYLQ